MKKEILLLVFCWSFTTIIHSTTYYVSPNGNDNNNGTSPATAFQTLNKINSLSFLPGDIISLEGGQIFSGYLILDDSGTMANPITLNTYNGGIATIQFDNQGTGKVKAIEIKNAAHLVINDLKLEGDYIASTNGTETTATANTGLDVIAESSDMTNITINNVEVSGFKWAGIKVKSSSGFTIDGVAIRYCLVHNNGFVGITTRGMLNSAIYNIKNIVIEHCTTHHNTGWSTSAAGSGIHLTNVSNGLVQYCVAHHNAGNNGAQNVGGGGGIWAADSENIIFQYNESHHNETMFADGCGFDMDGGVINGIMQYNYAHDNYGAGFLIFEYAPLNTINITLRYNVSENDGTWGKQGAIHLHRGSTGNEEFKDLYIYNNTIYNDNAATAMVEVNGGGGNLHIDNANFYNNLFIQPNGGDDFDLINGAVITEVNNFRDPLEGNALLVNPGHGGTVGNATLLANLTAYQAQANSPLIDNGLDLTTQNIPGFATMGLLDFFGNAIPHNGIYDIGAHEFSTCLGTELLVSNTFDDINSPTVPNWDFATLGAATATAYINNWDNAVIDITNGGISDFEVQLRQDNFGMTMGTFYILKIQARAEAPRTMNFKLRNRLNGSIKYLEQNIELTTVFQEYAFVIQAPVTDADLRLALLFGGDPNNVFLDYVSFKEYCSEINTAEIDCLDHIYLKDHNLLPHTYHAKVGLNSNAIIPSDEAVIFKASQEINLEAGFTVELNATFDAVIEVCN